MLKSLSAVENNVEILAKTLCCFGKKCWIIIANKVMCTVLKNYNLHSIFYKVQKHTRENSKLFGMHEENCV